MISRVFHLDFAIDVISYIFVIPISQSTDLKIMELTQMLIEILQFFEITYSKSWFILDILIQNSV